MSGLNYSVIRGQGLNLKSWVVCRLAEKYPLGYNEASLNTLLRSSDSDAWLSHLADQKAKARILARLGSATASQTKDIDKAKKMARELKRAKP